jgi:hypothetical protein
VLVLFASVVASRSQRPIVALPAPELTVSPEQKVLAEASTQLTLGHVDEAHRLLLGVAKTSALAEAPAFRLIESTWAESMFARAEQSPSVEARRGLLELVAQTTTVEAATRRKASELLTKLQNEAVDVTELPSGVAALPPSATAEPDVAGENADRNGDSAASQIAAVSKPASHAMTRTPPTKTAISPTGGTQAVAKTVLPTTSPSQSTGGQKTTTATEANAAELATSGKLNEAKAARDALKRKVSAGTASERDKRLLRALCRQLGDASCSK